MGPWLSAGVSAGVIAVLVGGCAARDTPYRFRGDLVGSVSAAAPPAQADARDRARPKKLRARVVAEGTAPKPVEEDTPEPPTPEPMAVPTTAPRSGSPGAQPPLASVLRGLVGGENKTTTDLHFALQALGHLGIEPDSKLGAVKNGRAFITLAKRRGASGVAGPALLGDLLVFDQVVSSERASLVGVVVGSRRDGTIEFIYLARSVVRRGYVNPARPRDKRDKRGRVLNTFVRHSNGGDPRGTAYLAGKLLANVVRLDRLVR